MYCAAQTICNPVSYQGKQTIRHGVAIINSVASSELSLSRDGEYAVRFGCGTRHGLIARSLVRNSIMRTRRGGKQVTEGVCDDRLYACYLGLYVPTRPFAPLGLRTVSALLRKTLSSPRTTRLHRQRPDHTILPLALGGGLCRMLDTASGVFTRSPRHRGMTAVCAK